MTNFDWRTDEEHGWERLPPLQPEPALDPRSWATALRLARRRWRPLLATLLVLAAGSVLSVRALVLRVQAAEATAQQELLAAHNVAVEAAKSGDEELFLTMLGGDRSWRQAQRAAFENGAVFGRSIMGLDWLEEAQRNAEVQHSPDLQQALVTSTLRYEGYAGGEGLQQIALQHFLHYEHDGNQWRLAPHEATVWSGWANFDEEIVQTVFPRRDEVLGERLTSDIVATVEILCDTALECPSRLRVLIRFEMNDESLHTPTLWIRNNRRDSFSLALPAPSLVGLPIDEVSYRALRNAYLRTIVAQLLDGMADREHVRGSALWDSLKRQIFADMGLIAWPTTTSPVTQTTTVGEDILALCADGVGKGASLWRYDGGSGSWSVELQGRNLTRMVALEGVPGVLLRDERETEPLAAMPPTGVLWWGDRRELAYFDEYYLGDAVPGSPTFIAGTPEGQNYWIYLGAAADCNGRYCEGIVVRDEPSNWSPDGTHTLFRRELEGSRSPPAADDLLWLGDSQGEALQRLEEGFYPFWIDNETFGYLTVPPGREQSFPFEYDLVTRMLDGDMVGDARTTQLHIVEALQTLAPESEDVQEMGVLINYAFARADQPDKVYIVAVRFVRMVSVDSAPEYTIFLLAIDARSGDVTIRIPSQRQQWTDLPRLSPDGKVLAYVAYDREDAKGVLAVHDLTQDPPSGNDWERLFMTDGGAGLYTSYDATRPFDWSQGQGRLLVLDHGILTVVDPHTRREQQLVPPTPSCAYAAWAD